MKLLTKILLFMLFPISYLCYYLYKKYKSKKLELQDVNEPIAPLVKLNVIPDTYSQNGQLTTNFNVKEFACKDGTQVPTIFLGNVQRLARNLQVLRDYIGKPILINSAYRHTEYNRKVGGATSSQHLTASASDIVIKGMSASQIKSTIEKLISQGDMAQGGLGSYPNFIHYDIRGYRARW